MFASFKTAALASVLGLGALASTPAAADSMTFGVSDGGVSITVSDRDGYGRGDGYRGGGWDRDRDWRRDDRRGGWDNGYGERRGCSPWRAVDKAERMGIRRARVVDSGYRGVVVRGHRYGDRVQVVFGNAPHCPVRGMY